VQEEASSQKGFGAEASGEEMTGVFLILRGRVMRRLLCGVLVAAASMMFAPSAMADLAIQPGSFTVTTSSDQAGARADLTTSFAFATNSKGALEGNPKDIIVDLPPGFVGDPVAVPSCALDQFAQVPGGTPLCPIDTQVGTVTLKLTLFPGFAKEYTVPVFNLVPNTGQPAKLGFHVLAFGIQGVVTLRPDDYGLRTTILNVSSLVDIDSSSLTLWAVPADTSHDPYRGSCLNQSGTSNGECPAGIAPAPFLSNPTQCTSSPLVATLSVTSWQQPEQSKTATAGVGPMTGCTRLDFSPTVSVQPDTMQADSPSGLSVDMRLPQYNDPLGLAEANLKKAVVTLPAGVSLSPSAADGLEACTLTQIGLGNAEQPACPNASKLGRVQIDTPLLHNPLEGSIYLAQPTCGGAGQPACTETSATNGELYGLYLAVEEPVSGVLVKLAGEVQADPLTGRLTTTFDNNPQQPFSDLKLEFFGGLRAPLTTPPGCGTYTTATQLTPWSAPESGLPASLSSSFEIETGPSGSLCANPLPFAPQLTAGTTNIQAGAFSPLTTTMSREDGNQNLQAIQLHMPPGLSGLLSSVKLCGEPQADAGTCGPESLIGHTIVSVGLGGDPFSVTDGQVFITGPYEGAPFGLSIVNPAKAGPFNLGTVVVRAKIEVDPHTAQLTVTTDNTGPYAIPHILDGIPLQIKHVNVTIDRDGFTFNPTSCKSMAITGALSSSEGATAAVSTPFQVTNCATLKFVPKFAVSTSGKTSKANGASLSVKLTYPNAPQGTQANIAKVKVDLPKQLPSRLTTLQKACVAATFEANPAACLAASIVGHAKAITPILPVPLEGPAYFVSHGGEAFPSLIIVLQGYGVTVDLVGTTFISKKGITSSTFRTVPDVPVGSFELTLLEGKYSALAANGNLCKSKLTMPTAFVAQNGAEIHESTNISVGGCSSALSVVSSRVRQRTLTMSVYAPGAGKVSAGGKGISSSSKIYSGREALTFTLKQRKAGKLTTKITLTYTPSKGKKQTKTIKARFTR
jgi:hypothetical protein